MVDTARNHPPEHDAESSGDVLSSIRRLIAQEGENPLAPAVPPTDINAFRQRYPRPAAAGPAPLVLSTDEMIRAEGGGDPKAAPPVENTFPQHDQGGGSAIAPAIPAPAESHDPQQDAGPATAAAQPVAAADGLSHPASPSLDASLAEHMESPDMTQNIDGFTLHAGAEHVFDPIPNAPAPLPAEQSPAEQGDFNLFVMEAGQTEGDRPLKGLIRDALLRELQGEIGNRLTRNMRHLIRIEIAQALREATRSS